MPDLDRELADAVSDLAASRRRARRAEADLDRAELTMRAVLADHIERGSRCSLHLDGETVRHGVPIRLGADFVLLDDDRRHRLIASHAIEAIVDDGAPHPARDDAQLASDVLVSDVLAEWCAERRAATLHTRTATLHGHLIGCGVDLVWLRTDEGRTSYVPLDSLTEASSSA